MFMPAAARPNESERYSTIARSPSSQPNRCSRGSASSITRRPSNSASTQTMTLAFRPGGAKIWRQDEMERNRCCPRLVPRDEVRSGARRRVVRRDRLRRDDRREISEPDRERMRADLPPLARFPAGADVLDVARAPNAQSGAISLLPLTHFAGKQRRLVSRGRYTARLQ